MAKALRPLLAIMATIAVMGPSALADDSDELDRAQRVAYCLDGVQYQQETVCRSQPTSIAKGSPGDICGQYTRQLSRLRLYVVGAMARHPGEPGFTGPVAVALESGKTDADMCKTEALSSSDAVSHCIGNAKSKEDGERCIEAVEAPTCARFRSRCTDIDRMLPF